jgi:hypothetical protein
MLKSHHLYIFVQLAEHRQNVEQDAARVESLHNFGIEDAFAILSDPILKHLLGDGFNVCLSN